MPYTDILVQIDAAASPSRYEIAAQLAARSGGHLTGAYLKTTLINQYNNIGTIGYLPPEDLNRLIQENNQGQDDDAAKAAAVLTRSAAAAKVECDWRTIGGDTPDDLIREARRTDLVILPPPLSSAAYNVHASAVDIALGSGGPVLIAPNTVEQVQIGARVLVGWNGSREAARALRDALPLLRSDVVLEVRIAQPKDATGDEIGQLRRHIARHGLKANIVSVVDEGQSVSAWLKAEAARNGCDLMVMGLYGHTRMREFVLGGVSRDLVHNPPLPLLVSH